MNATPATIRTAARRAGWNALSDSDIAPWFTRGDDVIVVQFNDNGQVDGVIVNGVDHADNAAAVALHAFTHVRTGR